MTAKVVDGALLTIRTARTSHWCELGRHAIEPGERYEDWRVPPWRGGNESPRWWRGKRHADEGREHGITCDETDAYREYATREKAEVPES